MLDIQIDLVPYGEEAHRRSIGNVRIANDGTGTLTYGNYNITFADGIEVKVQGYERKSDVYVLLGMAIEQRKLKLAEIARQNQEASGVHTLSG